MLYTFLEKFLDIPLLRNQVLYFSQARTLQLYFGFRVNVHSFILTGRCRFIGVYQNSPYEIMIAF